MSLSDTLAALSEAARNARTGDEYRKRWHILTKELVNAYRTGQLVPVPSVERVEAVLNAFFPYQTSGIRNMAAIAVIAAMKDGKP